MMNSYTVYKDKNLYWHIVPKQLYTASYQEHAANGTFSSHVMN